MIQDIIKKASGVFLWVVLACRSLLQGFAAYDYLEDLQLRVDELPPELADLFGLILKRVSPRYRTQGARLLRICYENHLLNITAGVPTLTLAFFDAAQMNVRARPLSSQLTNSHKRRNCVTPEARLRSRCCGILEVKPASTYPVCCLCEESNWEINGHDPLIDSMADFMHGTVFEFLDSPGAWDLEYIKIDDLAFDASAVLSCMTATAGSLSALSQYHVNRAGESIRKALVYALRLETHRPDLLHPVGAHLGAAILPECEIGRICRTATYPIHPNRIGC
jgi:hypothetical protein